LLPTYVVPVYNFFDFYNTLQNLFSLLHVLEELR